MLRAQIRHACGVALLRSVVVGPQGFEPWTFGFKVRCSASLSQGPAIACPTLRVPREREVHHHPDAFAPTGAKRDLGRATSATRVPRVAIS